MNSPYKFRSPMTPPDDDWSEYISNETIVEQSGWRSTEQIVTSMQEAGARLQAYRKGQFDLDGDIGDDEELPDVILRGPDIDFTDVDKVQRIARAEVARARSKAEEAVRVNNEPSVVPEPVVAPVAQS